MSSTSDNLIGHLLDCCRRTEDSEDLAGDVAFQTPHDLRLTLAFGKPATHVPLGGWMPTEPYDDDAM
jgi:hypothetical protein